MKTLAWIIGVASLCACTSMPETSGAGEQERPSIIDQSTNPGDVYFGG